MDVSLVSVGNSCCINCGRRKLYCHNDCEYYRRYYEENEELKKRRKLDDEYFRYAGENIRERNYREARKRY